jgi:hypothetical protein
VAGKCAVVGASTTESASGSGRGAVMIDEAHGKDRAASKRAVSADARGPWEREKGAHARGVGADSSVPLAREREREREREGTWAQVGTDRRGPAVREGWTCVGEDD